MSVASLFNKPSVASESQKNLHPAWEVFCRTNPPSETKFICMYGVRCDHVGLFRSCSECINRVRPCNREITATAGKVQNLKTHLRIVHEFSALGKRDRSEASSATEARSATASSPPPSAPIQISLPDSVALAKKVIVDPLLANATQRDLEAIAFADNGLSFRVCQSLSFRNAYKPTIALGRDMAEQIKTTARQLLALKNTLCATLPVTLAFDSGTVWRRWFAVMAVVPGKIPHIVGIKNAESFPDKRLTAENLETYLVELAKKMEKDGAWVVACVADNAGNMQKAIESSSMLAIKCGAQFPGLRSSGTIHVRHQLATVQFCYRFRHGNRIWSSRLAQRSAL